MIFFSCGHLCFPLRQLVWVVSLQNVGDQEMSSVFRTCRNTIASHLFYGMVNLDFGNFM